MPIATLEFELPEEQSEFEEAINGGNFKSVLWDLDQALRQKIKYEEHSEDFKDACEKLREELHDKLREANLSIE